MRISEEEALEAMIKSGVHGQQRPRHVYAIALYNGKNYFMARNTSGREHAEVKAIGHLKGLLKLRQLQPRGIKLFVSASPCGECSQRIIAFVETARWQHGVHLKIEVVFSSFYRIQRPSCNRRNCRDHRHCPSDDDHWTQVEGLKKLRDTPGVILRTFSQQDWHNLTNVLGVCNIDYRCRKKEDELLKKDFQEIMGGHRSISRYQSQSPGAVGSSGVALPTDQCRANMSTDDCLVDVCTAISFVNMSIEDYLVKACSDDRVVNVSNDDCLVNVSTDDCLVNMSTDDCLVNVSNDDSLVNESTAISFVNMSIEDYLVKACSEDRVVNVSTDDCLVNLCPDDSLVNESTDECCINLLTLPPKAVDLKLSLMRGLKMPWIFTAIFILSLIVLAIIIITHNSI